MSATARPRNASRTARHERRIVRLTWLYIITAVLAMVSAVITIWLVQHDRAVVAIITGLTTAAMLWAMFFMIGRYRLMVGRR